MDRNPFFFSRPTPFGSVYQVQQAGAEYLFEDSSEEEDNSVRRRPRHYIERMRESGHERLLADYFNVGATYNDDIFRRRFQMRHSLFERIIECLKNHDTFFQESFDATGRRSLSAHQKCTAAMRVLGYGCSADSVDEYLRIGETTVLNSVRQFVKGIRSIFEEQYIRAPTADDKERLLAWGESRGFPGMLGSIDCMHWDWKNCPVAWQGQFSRGDHRKPIVMLEAVASADTRIWHAFFGIPGSSNDLNVLARSPLFNNLYNGLAPKVQFQVNDNVYDMGYYLADGIYPEWLIFVKTISLPQSRQEQLFAQCHESARKDIERTFGILQNQFAILSVPPRVWDRETLSDIMYACIILHNMIVENEGHTIPPANILEQCQYDLVVEPPEFTMGSNYSQMEYLGRLARARDKALHRQLKVDLVKHVASKFG